MYINTDYLTAKISYDSEASFNSIFIVFSYSLGNCNIKGLACESYYDNETHEKSLKFC